ncbi:MAG: EAL domain-containing protein [Campylobacterota bacterium]|nr:EAL domain-containing protein [Campylobacterota bacterium]
MNNLIFDNISKTVGNSHALEKMLSEYIDLVLAKFNCSSAEIYKKVEHDYQLIHTQPKSALTENCDYLHAVEKLHKLFIEDSSPMIVKEVDDKYYYLFELKDLGYLILTKDDQTMDTATINELINMNLKFVKTISDFDAYSSLYAFGVKLKNETNLLESIIDTVPLRIFWKDTSSRYLGGNQLFLKDAKLENTHTLIGKTDYQLPWSIEDAEYYRQTDIEIMNTGIARFNFEEPYCQEDGSQGWVSTSFVPLKNDEGKVLGILGTYHDITIEKEHQRNLKVHREELEYLATHDSLTKLPNRTLFLDRLNQAIYLAARNQTKIAILFIDMDRFKSINDSLGHIVGDLVIREIAQRLNSQIRVTDTLARFGGDEFVMLIDNLSHTMTLTHILGKLMESLQTPIRINGHTLFTTVSIGVSIYPHDSLKANDLLKNADIAMYKAKSLGRNNYQFYTEDMTLKALARMELELNLRSAIENKDFTLYYQPQFKVDTLENTLIGMEALIRWEHASKGFIAPEIFIPVAEDTGLIIPLGRWILEEGMKQMVQWYKKGLNPGVLAINLSMLELQKNDFVDYVTTLLAKTACKAQWIEIEITESQMMKNPEITISTLEALHNLGIKIAIDDFGTGYSSLSYLKRLPIDTVKIDKSFIENLPQDEEDLTITQAIFALARSLKLEVIAEGVERVEQKEILIATGCKYIQGYYYSKPLPLQQIEKLFI